MEPEKKYTVYPAFTGYGQKGKGFTNLKDVQNYIRDEIKAGRIVTVRMNRQPKSGGK